MAFDAKNIMDRVKGVNWRRLAAYANPQAVKDLDVFLDKLPLRAGSKGLYIAASIWVVAAMSLLLAYSKSVNLQDIRKQMSQAEAMRPSVPIVTYKPVPDDQIKAQVEKMKNVYKTLTINMSNGQVDIAATTTRDFPAWRAAIGDLSFGGNAWRVQTKLLCAGRECKGQPLQASLSVQQLDISVPAATTKEQPTGGGSHDKK